ncbi:DUF1488 family protein [Polynucleobacter difficilis]|jgi:hypothetical protein|uniref:DUF1488 family protein n=1 Tax=Polynucleobacter difficilis TaxID=556054 RepID=UPI000D333F28|nr:DUF1488 family protein [Polynucleobacter difficilis]
MKIDFIGPATMAEDGGVIYPALLNGQKLACRFSYEALDDVEPDGILGDALVHFTNHQLKLLSIAEQKIRSGHAHDGQIQIFSSDLSL